MIDKWELQLRLSEDEWSFMGEFDSPSAAVGAMLDQQDRDERASLRYEYRVVYTGTGIPEYGED